MNARAGMLLAASAVLSPMLLSCSDPACGQQGFDVVTSTEQIIDVNVSDVACAAVMPPCIAQDDAGTCTKFYVVPIATGNCHVDVDLAKGTRFSADVKIIRGSGSCNGFYTAVAADSIVDVP